MLFKSTKSENILPFDGEVYYFGSILGSDAVNKYYQNLLNNLNWVFDEAVIYGKKIQTKRKIAWFGDGGESFSYSGSIRYATNWTSELLELKNIVEKKSNFKFNSCLLNLYHNGNEGMTWHTDKTKEFGQKSTIATVSLGAERRFDFKHISTGQKVSINLENGSLLITAGDTQINWLHQVPKTAKVLTPRISLTFRQLLET